MPKPVERTLRSKACCRVTIQQSWWYRKYSSRARNDPPLCHWLKLSGRWLEVAGFEPGQRVRSTVEDKRLVITPD
ncbi:SymE family type I addiction module toxin [Paraburkholderia unamae]|uniref:SymE family type I addiction module toxin n=1 Tax=Paraburkholderia unamae TaxID=219649 RepID=A0ACC6RDZ1_9BURK